MLRMDYTERRNPTSLGGWLVLLTGWALLVVVIVPVVCVAAVCSLVGRTGR